MAGIKAIGFEELKERTAKLQNLIAGETLEMAMNEAARVMKEAIRGAAPIANVSNLARRRRTGHYAGQLRDSVTILKTKAKGLFVTAQSTLVGTVLVGPERKKGYYGYFQEKGWTSTGSRRRERKATATTHSQSGMKGGTIIPAPHKDWFKGAVDASEVKAAKAGEAVFDNVIKDFT